MLGRNRLLIALIGIALGFAVLLTAVMHFAQPAQTESTPSSNTDALFAARFTDAQGKTQPMTQWQHQVIVVNFWATWCPPCRDEMPELSALQEKYRDRGLVVLGISTDDVAKTRQFAQDMPVSYPLLASEADTMNLAATLGNDRDVLPYTLVLRRDGSVATRYFGRIDSQALESTLSPLL